MKVISHFPFQPQPSQIPLLFPKGGWRDCGRYWINNSEQGSVGWLTARKGLVSLKNLVGDGFETKSSNPTQILISSRVTGSNFGSAAGLSKFSTPGELALYVSGLQEQKFTEESLKNMAHGTKYEPEARAWYERSTGYEVEEVGLAVPKWNFHLGASVDGIVKDQEGIIEIKCPKKMYGPLIDHEKQISFGCEPESKYYHKHIWDSHYAQMQGGMAILDKKWCDYIVYSTSDRKVYKERILFNREYWENRLYPSLQSFFHTNLFPLLESIIEKY